MCDIEESRENEGYDRSASRHVLVENERKDSVTLVYVDWWIDRIHQQGKIDDRWMDQSYEGWQGWKLLLGNSIQNVNGCLLARVAHGRQNVDSEL